MMVFVNEIEKSDGISLKDFKLFIQILSPFAPHITEEIWQNLGEKKSINKSFWPKWDKRKIIDDMIKVTIQINGKVRTEIMISKDMTEAEIKEISLKNSVVINWIENKDIKRFIYIPGRVINIVI
jgi:leucyl-tRNA synthetase